MNLGVIFNRPFSLFLRITLSLGASHRYFFFAPLVILPHISLELALKRLPMFSLLLVLITEIPSFLDFQPSLSVLFSFYKTMLLFFYIAVVNLLILYNLNTTKPPVAFY